MKNLMIVLEGIGLTLKNVAFVKIYLLHFDEDYSMMNEVYATYFDADKRCYICMCVCMYVCVCVCVCVYLCIYMYIYVYAYIYFVLMRIIA
jgi:enamine deaminase RidA (YjgF/YER057c/UK114 family)